MDQETSKKINVLRFPLIIGVVFIHAYGSPAPMGGSLSGIFALAAQDYISQVLARICVPLFYLISGYLFFFDFSGSMKDFGRKLKARVRTLLIPYLFWNIVTLIFFWMLPRIPALNVQLSGNYPLISSYRVFDYVNVIFGISREPIAYQFWFIRDLMILVAVSPVIYLFIQRIPMLLAAVLGCAWLFHLYPINPMLLGAAFFFIFGAVLSSQKSQFNLLDKFGKIGFLVYLTISFIDLATRKEWFNSYVHGIGMLFGMVGVYWLAGFPQKINSLGNFLRKLSSASFFVFATHEPFLTAMKKFSNKLLNPKDGFSVLLLYLINPILVIAICTSVYFVIKRVTPGFSRIICGGRS